MTLPFAILSFIAQASAPGQMQLPPPTVEQSRMDVCLDQASDDPASAIANANIWLAEAHEAEAAFPRQCLGIAYTRLLRWQAAQTAFLAARDVAPPDDHGWRARLGGMAGNAALAQEDFGAALANLETGLGDALAAANMELASQIGVDMARAMVGLKRPDEAAGILAQARAANAQNPESWLLSATLARRMDDLETAQYYIETAALLDPRNPQVGLEAGVIAILSGKDDAARKSWQSVLAAAPGSEEAVTAQSYLDQLDQENPPRPQETGQ